MPFAGQCISFAPSSPPPSHPEPRYQATWSSLTGTVHVTNEQAMRALWEKGFFGKGSLSRSEPTWLEREKRKLGVTAADTSEQWTRQRREERRQFKNERAKKEREAIEERLRQETREAGIETANATNDIPYEMGTSTDEHHTITLRAANSASLSEPIAEPTATAERPPNPESPSTPLHDEDQPPPIPLGPILNREHLQLSSVEAFFLTYALGVLTIHQPDSQTPSLPPNSSPCWVVRSGIKFGVDYLLYQRGPAFAHAQFSIIVVPSYSHAYWSGRGTGEVEKGQKGKGKSWWWLHAVNRVQSQVLKNLVVVFVEVPPPLEGGFGRGDGDGELEDVTGLLKRYKIREMVLKRWTPNRTRD
ncbi:ceramide glucosyltransferase [Physcia stellaris]|nr:ceramide glucosyltransferase [Physcia stellaris]